MLQAAGAEEISYRSNKIHQTWYTDYKPISVYQEVAHVWHDYVILWTSPCNAGIGRLAPLPKFKFWDKKKTYQFLDLVAMVHCH